MKSENQIIVRLSSHSKSRSHFSVCCRSLKALVKEIFFRQFRCLFFSVYFLNTLLSTPSKVTIVIQFIILGINIFWALLRAHFNAHLKTWAKMSLSRAQNILIANINSTVLIERFSIAFTANDKRQAEIFRLPRTREIYLVSAYILPVSHS